MQYHLVSRFQYWALVSICAHNGSGEVFGVHCFFWLDAWCDARGRTMKEVEFMCWEVQLTTTTVAWWAFHFGNTPVATWNPRGRQLKSCADWRVVDVAKWNNPIKGMGVWQPCVITTTIGILFLLSTTDQWPHVSPLSTVYSTWNGPALRTYISRRLIKTSKKVSTVQSISWNLTRLNIEGTLGVRSTVLPCLQRLFRYTFPNSACTWCCFQLCSTYSA